MKILSVFQAPCDRQSPKVIMFLKLLLLFTLVPAIELFVLIPLAAQIGVPATIAIILTTGFIGAWLGKRQGWEAIKRIQTELAQGQLPGDAITDAILILIACTLLITPGVLTDAVGIALLIPLIRTPIKALARRRFTKMLQNPSVTVIDVSSSTRVSRPQRHPDADVIDITPNEERSFTLAE